MKPFEKWLLLGSAGLTTLTGVVYAWMRYLLEPMDESSIVNHPLEPWALKAHILVAPVLVFATGMIAVSHVWKHYRGRVRQGRRSGLVTAGVFVPMTVTGYLIQSVTSPGALLAVVVVHLVTGGLFAGGLALHYREFVTRGPWTGFTPPSNRR